MLENKGYGATLGTCSADPYFCSLAARYASFTNSHGVSHPSQPNYTAIAAGSTLGCTADNCVGAGAYGNTNLGGQLTASATPWVGWMESMPSPCYTGTGSGGYALKHNPFVIFKDNVTGTCHIQPYPGVSAAVSTLDGANPPDFAWISPNLNDDMHDGTVQQGDAWLSTYVPKFQAAGATVIVVFDEGNTSDQAGGGGHVFADISGAHVTAGTNGTSYDHYGLLHGLLNYFNLGCLSSSCGATPVSIP